MYHFFFFILFRPLLDTSRSHKERKKQQRRETVKWTTRLKEERKRERKKKRDGNQEESTRNKPNRRPWRNALRWALDIPLTEEISLKQQRTWAARRHSGERKETEDAQSTVALTVSSSPGWIFPYSVIKSWLSCNFSKLKNQQAPIHTLRTSASHLESPFVFRENSTSTTPTSSSAIQFTDTICPLDYHGVFSLRSALCPTKTMKTTLTLSPASNRAWNTIILPKCTK